MIHEGCHAILEHKEVRFRATASNRDRFSPRAKRDEIATNRLTASILAPFDKAEFNPDMTVEGVQQRFGLSKPAATTRLEEFARMFRKKTGTRRDLPPGVADFLVRQKRKGYRVTSLGDVSALSPQPTKQYEGDACPGCSQFKLVRNGLSKTCDNCGTKTGDD